MKRKCFNPYRAPPDFWLSFITLLSREDERCSSVGNVNSKWSSWANMSHSSEAWKEILRFINRNSWNVFMVSINMIAIIWRLNIRMTLNIHGSIKAWWWWSPSIINIQSYFTLCITRRYIFRRGRPVDENCWEINVCSWTVRWLQLLKWSDERDDHFVKMLRRASLMNTKLWFAHRWGSIIIRFKCADN